MMQRWYRAYYAYGSVQKYVERISNQVRRYDLGDVLPRVCYERPGRRRRGQQQFYLFVGINSEQKGHIPEKISGFLTQVLQLRQQVGDFSFEEIKTMVSAEIDIEDYARKIIYTPPSPPDFDVPFDFTTFSGIEPAHDGTTTEAYNQLLYWASTVGSGTWQSFKALCRHFGITDESTNARHIFRRFRLLGHVEYYDGGKKWTICPPCLVEIGQNEHGAHQYVLAGQRSQKFIQWLQDIADIEVLPQVEKNAPDCVAIDVESREQLERIIKDSSRISSLSLRYAGEASSRLASILPDLEGYQKSLTSILHIVPSFYTIQKWHHEQFIDCVFQQETGFYHLSSENTNGYAHHFTLFYDAPHERWQQGDWYGLRYLARYKAGEKCEVFSHPSQSRVALHINYCWPDLYERALVLSSGLLPERRQGWFYYNNVSPVVIRTLAQKLSAEEVQE